ncbi:MAG: DUF1080 domain-containing protein [Gemmatimonadetes bacterium]|nr:DUF1080 domain-containing protein [Gemmatimonadota bacterium]
MRALLAAVLLTALCSLHGLTAQNTLSPEERAAGWRLLFDGRSLAAWRGYNQPTMPAGWQAVDGALTRVEPAGDIITRDQFGDFELALDWKIAPGGNSGIMFRVRETADPAYYTGPEIQLLDTTGLAEQPAPETSTGSNYALHAPTAALAKPAGEWNAFRLLVRGNHVEHWLNGTRIVSYELGSDDWKRRVAASKFKDMPGYGVAPRGYIALQEHGAMVAFRNIRIRELK